MTFPARTLLLWYYKCQRSNPHYEDYHNLYTDYFLGLRKLQQWLESDITLEDCFRNIPHLQVPICLMNYTIQELAKHLVCSPEYVFHTLLDFYEEEYQS